MSDLSELFQRDPLKLSDQDITTIVEELRKKRKRYNLGDKTAGSTKPLTKTQKTQESALKITGDIDLSSII